MRWVITLFEEISPFIRSLRIFRSEDHPAYDDSLDNHLLACHRDLLQCGLGLSFAPLVDVTISSESLYNLQFIPFLCESAPNLLSIAFEYQGACFEHYDGASSPGFPRCLTRDTQLTRLSMTFGCHGASQMNNPIPTFLDLLRRSPNLEVLLCDASDAGSAVGSVDAVRCMSSLRDLLWRWEIAYQEPEPFNIPGDGPGLAAPRRAVLTHYGWSFFVSPTVCDLELQLTGRSRRTWLPLCPPSRSFTSIAQNVRGSRPKSSHVRPSAAAPVARRLP